MSNNERTYIMVKPDGVQRGLVGAIIARFEQKGYYLRALKLITPTRELLEEHYKDLNDRPFFQALITYMLSGPVVGMVWEGKGVVATGRLLLGATNPLQSNPGTIRGDFCIITGRNICHGSDSVVNAEKEISLWFGKELAEWTHHSHNWIYE
ncbi:nucleoside diphosphate kinase 1-like [Nymphaea colorata]|uniref:nucleoside diphosphate kinase 1-like n=1 Tax=Nymphaea colorata TaxID=210225 RepID=UPI00129D5FFC|nr:nucleoside diphosphate kinase 1-like [Nymphaea colorata]